VIRGILAVVAGFVAWSVIWFGGNTAVQSAFASRFNTDRSTSDVVVLVLLLLLSVVCSLAAGFVTALVARKRWQAMAWVQAIVLLAVGIVVEVGMWKLLPAWYHVVFLLLLVPATLVGARLRKQAAT
jgi:hypothetical protein